MPGAFSTALPSPTSMAARPPAGSVVHVSPWRDGARNVLLRSLAKVGRHAEGEDEDEDERHASVMCAAPEASRRPGQRSRCGPTISSDSEWY